MIRVGFLHIEIHVEFCGKWFSIGFRGKVQTSSNFHVEIVEKQPGTFR